MEWANVVLIALVFGALGGCIGALLVELWNRR